MVFKIVASIIRGDLKDLLDERAEEVAHHSQIDNQKYDHEHTTPLSMNIIKFTGVMG
jgi:hypothetical protein